MGEGTTFHWFVDGESLGIGYAQKWALPMAGDEVLMQPRLNHQEGVPDEPDYRVRVTHRTFSAPEQDHPWIQVHTKRVRDQHGAVPMLVQGERDDVTFLEDLLGSIQLHINWRYVTGQMTTEQKNRFADAVEASSRRLNADDPDYGGMTVDRWWQ